MKLDRVGLSVEEVDADAEAGSTESSFFRMLFRRTADAVVTAVAEEE